ncbi:MAG: hypothetical protein M3387_01650 [Actinomycetota bacterium]|nr:hypothetical protein [Actinomycetota bacterium]
MIRDSRTARLAAGGGLAVLATVTLPSGLGPFGLLVALLAAVVLVELSDTLGRDHARPILPAAAIPALGLPLAAIVAPDGIWEWLPVFLAGMLLAGFALLLAGRRDRVTEALAGTCLAGTVIGLGAGSLVLLRAAPGGYALALATLLLTAVPAAVVWIARELAGQPSRIARVSGLVVVGVMGGVLIAVYDPLLSPALVLCLAAIGWAASGLARALQPGTVDEAAGVLLPLLGGCLLAAPAAYLLARFVADWPRV